MSRICTTNARTLGRGLCIITGASKGLGRALAHEAAHLLEPSSVLLLVARSGALLKKLREELQSSIGQQQLEIHCITADLSTKEGVNTTLKVARKQKVLNETDHVLLINNAASLGAISAFESFTDVESVNSYLSLNVSSALALTAGILQMFPARPGLRRSVVNISSTFAQQVSPSWVLYCTGKAARKMMFNVLAEERPDVKVLNYSPGPLDTEMQEEIERVTGIAYHLLPCQESAVKLMKLLLDNEFASGVHLDFFDV
ncbi:sepiapterin reductase b [Echeneis naucrates]|nr:sepiapterin reductase-like [Echeneis naucrates]